MISNKEKYNKYRPKKFLGQNFLVDENIARKIVVSLDISPGDPVAEIGPGQGVLTKYIHKLTGNFAAVELDKSIYEKLSSEYKGRLLIIHKDFLDVDINEELLKSFDLKGEKRKLKIIGNIPYNITTEILFKLYDSAGIIDSAVLMMQKEVARRLTAKPGTKDYGILAVQTQINSSPEILFGVPPTAFFPKPRVESSVVRFRFGKNEFKITDRDGFKTLVKQSFGQRRKTMKNSLKVFFEKNRIQTEDIDFDFSRRAETVGIEEFIALHEKILFLQKHSG